MKEALIIIGIVFLIIVAFSPDKDPKPKAIRPKPKQKLFKPNQYKIKK